jgi:hypothetical protein
LTVDSGLSAVNDLFNVDEDSVNFPLNVLANDVNEIGGTVTITQVGPDQPWRHGDDWDQRWSESAVFAGGEFLRRGDFTYTITAGGLTSTAGDGPSRSR